MYAIFTDGSRQYRAEASKSVVIDYRAETSIGDIIELDQVLLISNDVEQKIGLPTVSGAKVIGKVVDFPKVKTVTQKFRRRKASKRLRGHTQPHLKIMIESIVG